LVLWESDQTIRHHDANAKTWTVMEATEPYSDCQAKARQDVQRSVEEAKREGPHYTLRETTVTTSDDGPTFISLVSYQCFPDTVDLRGLKRKS
jgi:hypothetical protein